MAYLWDQDNQPGWRTEFISVQNSTSTALDAHETWTGQAEDVMGFSSITVTMYSDVSSAYDGVVAQFSTDGVNWRWSHGLTYDGGSARTFLAIPQARYFRLKLTNNSTAQTDLEIVTYYHRHNPFEMSSGDFLVMVGKEQVFGHHLIHKFGRNDAIGTTLTPITFSGFYRTPTPSNATTLRIKAGGNANDTAAGSGARAVRLEGLDETGNFAEETLVTAGASASASSSTTFMRLFRAYVSASGTYATQTAGSHAASITIENTAGTQNWATIDATAFPNGQTEIGAYTSPAGHRIYLLRAQFYTDSGKVTRVDGFRRANVLNETAPYEPMRLFLDTEIRGERGVYEPASPVRFGKLTDIGFLAKVDTGTAVVACDFDLLLVGE